MLRFFREYKKTFQENFDSYFFPEEVVQIREGRANIARNKEILKKIQDETAEIKAKIEKRSQPKGR